MFFLFHFKTVSHNTSIQYANHHLKSPEKKRKEKQTAKKTKQKSLKTSELC